MKVMQERYNDKNIKVIKTKVYCLRHEPVKKDWGLKNPASHTTLGRVKSVTQPSSSLILSWRSANQAPRGRREG